MAKGKKKRGRPAQVTVEAIRRAIEWANQQPTGVTFQQLGEQVGLTAGAFHKRLLKEGLADQLKNRPAKRNRAGGSSGASRHDDARLAALFKHFPNARQTVKLFEKAQREVRKARRLAIKIAKGPAGHAVPLPQVLACLDRVLNELQTTEVYAVCIACDGSGKGRHDARCQACHGRGWLPCGTIVGLTPEKAAKSGNSSVQAKCRKS